MMKKNPTTFIHIAACIFLSACASQQGQGISTLDDLTISASNDGVFTKPINLHYPLQTRFLSVNGQLPVPDPGSACLASSFRPASSIVCFSATDITQIRVTRYEYNGSRDSLYDLQQDFADLQLQLVELVIEESASSSQNGNTYVPPQSVVQSAKTITEQAKNLSNEFKEKNAFIFRWQSEGEATSGSTLGTLLSANGAMEYSERGVVIVGGLTVSQLLLSLNGYQSELKRYPKGTKIATFTMGADHLIYFTGADLSAALSTSLNSDLEDLSQNLSPETKIALNAYAAIGRAQENQGNFSAPTVHNYSLDVYDSERPNQQVFYSTMTDIESLLDAFSDTY